MVTQAYYTDPHTQVYLDYLKEVARREREREERKRQEEAGGGPLGAGLGAVGGAVVGGLLAAPTGGLSVLAGAALGGSVGRQAGGAIGTGISPPGGSAGAARNQAWQQGIGAVTDLGVAAATYADLQAPHEAPGQSPSFMEVFAGQQGYGARGLANFYGERRDVQRDALYQQQIQDRQLKVQQAREQYRQGMEGAGFEVVPNPRGIQGRYDEISAILKNEGNLTPVQQDQALQMVGSKPLDMMVRRRPPTPDNLWQQSTWFDEETGERYDYTTRNGSTKWSQLTSNAKKREADQKHILAAQKQAKDSFLDETDRESPPTAWEIEKRAREILDTTARILEGKPLGLQPQVSQPAAPQGVPPSQQSQQMGWMDRAKLMASIPMGIMGGAGAQQAPGQPGQQAPPSPIEQTAAQLTGMVQSLGGDVGKWPKEARAEGKVLAQRFQAELEAQFGEAKNTPAELLPILEIVAKLL